MFSQPSATMSGSQTPAAQRVPDHSSATSELLVTASKSAAHLFKLPRELRDMIYTYALGGNAWHIVNVGCEIINVGSEKKYDRASRVRMVPNPLKNIHSLLCVSRQLHTETCLLPYALSTFRFGYLDDAITWARALSTQQRNAIKALELGTDTSWGYLNASNRITTDDVPGWWTREALAELEMPALETLRVTAYIEAPDASLRDQNVRSAGLSRVVQELEDMVKSPGQGARITVQLEYDTIDGPCY